MDKKALLSTMALVTFLLATAPATAADHDIIDSIKDSDTENAILTIDSECCKGKGGDGIK